MDKTLLLKDSVRAILFTVRLLRELRGTKVHDESNECGIGDGKDYGDKASFKG